MGLQAKFLLVGIFVFLYFVSINEAQGPPVKYFMGKINGKPLRDHYANQALGLPADYDCGVSSTEASKWNVTINQWIDQPLDHFDTSINVTWKMRYEYKEKYFQKRNDSDIVFLLIGGEGSIPNNWICFENYTWTQLAIENKAFMFQTEHRYFGQSRPTKDMSTENLKWLTMEQALADLNNFIVQMNRQFNFTNPRWVAFGGSYPGTMAANLRKYYPNITVGNVASSAPLWAKVDFWEYAAKMEEAIYWENRTCGDNIKTAFEQLKQWTFTNRTLLNTKFGITPQLCDNSSLCNTTDLDTTNFLATIFNTFQGIVQYTFDARNNETLAKNGLSIANLCTKMNDPTVPLIDRIVNVYNWELAWDYEPDTPPPPTVLYNNYTAMLAPMVNVSFDSDGDDRGWMWLCCNEFGWLQTTDNGNGMFKDVIPLNYYLQMCTDLFGVNNSFVQNQVSASLIKFGLPSSFNATNVILPNGSLDPWSTLGCNVTNNATHQIPVTTLGGAHCVDMYPYNSIEPNAVNYTVHLVRQEVMYYLNQTPSNVVPPPSSPPSGASMTSVSLATLLLGLFIYYY